MKAKPAPEVYKKVKTLGEGSFGKAYLVECKSDKVSYLHPSTSIVPRSHQADRYNTNE